MAWKVEIEVEEVFFFFHFLLISSANSERFTAISSETRTPCTDCTFYFDVLSTSRIKSCRSWMSIFPLQTENMWKKLRKSSSWSPASAWASAMEEHILFPTSAQSRKRSVYSWSSCWTLPIYLFLLLFCISLYQLSIASLKQEISFSVFPLWNFIFNHF